MQSDVGLEYVSADSALYVAETLREMSRFQWISRVPQTLSLAREIIHSVAPDLMNHPEQTAFRSLGTVYGECSAALGGGVFSRGVSTRPENRQQALPGTKRHRA